MNFEFDNFHYFKIIIIIKIIIRRIITILFSIRIIMIQFESR